MNKLFLGKPSQKILSWIESHYKKPNYLCFTAEQNGSQISMVKSGNPPTLNLEYSIDNGSTWLKFKPGITVINLRYAGDKAYLRATTDGNSATSTGFYSYWNFSMFGKIAASGDITTLLNQNGLTTLLSDYTFNQIFYYCDALTQAPILPATKLANYCYHGMFYGCTSLTQAPALPATTLADNCYLAMFHSCTSLTQAPVLPATQLTESCYQSMFYSCSSLTAAPELPATQLTEYCYESMFSRCTSLSQAPELPATTLTKRCYYSMFQNCTSLSSINVSFTEWTPANATEGWLNNVNSTGNFYCPASLPDERSASYIPEGWTKVNTKFLCFTAEQNNSQISLSKTGNPPTLNLEYSIDNGSTWQVFIPNSTIINLVNIGNNVYLRANAKNTSIAIDKDNYWSFSMFGKIAASGNITTLLSRNGLTILTSSYTFCKLFQNCSSLTKAPELPVTILTDNCYHSMFQNCTSLSSINVSFTEWTPANATERWLINVNSTGNFYCPASLPDERGISYIPENWDIIKPLKTSCLCFTAEQANSTIRLTDATEEWPENYNYLNYSTDGIIWNSYAGQTITLNNIGNKVYFNTPEGITNHSWGDSLEFYFKMTGLIAASGNIMSLVFMNGQIDHIPQNEDLYFYQLFIDCSSLTRAPELPATTLADYCYDSMFSNCSALTQAPELPATTLACMCYADMFVDCISLSSVSVNFTEWSDDIRCWLNNVNSTGNFYCPASLPDERGISYIPEGWTKIDK